MATASDISNAELVLLKVLWQESPLSSADIVERVQRHEEWHEKTIKTMLNRLVKKAVLSYEQAGRKYLYAPLISQQVYQKQVSTRLLDNVFSGSVSGLVAGFAQQGALKSDDVEALKSLIAEWEKDQGGQS
ncbi:MAG: BlaI/MecI/CopY family transcriptional regulator [Idiomarina sp.]|nr:BlaI/MecI/CopY family transcriptional regulator [Idiomarina sp.]